MPPQEAGPPKDQLNQIADKIKSAGSVLVTVSSNPSIDQLAACIGLTLALNKTGKHGTAVYSGKTPSTIEFLKPEKTLEQDTNSLRDFIISLDKSKADKLRYKVEDDVVKIFITPYKTSISEKDFNFSQGEFNVDVVLALGVDKKSDLDKAITSHGRILHDAAVISINTSASSGHNPLGSIEWIANEASSLCEMVADLVNELDGSALDSQIATALLTGVVVETDRFSNEKSRPHTMKIAGKLMESGASTQLITTKLGEAPKPSVQPSGAGKSSEDGVLEIEHVDTGKDKSAEIPPVAPPDKQPEPKQEEKPPEPPKEDEPPAKEERSSAIGDVRPSEGEDPSVSDGPRYVTEPPSSGGRLTANDMPEYKSYDPTTDPLSQDGGSSIIDRKKTEDRQSGKTDNDEMGGKTLEDIEESVESPHKAGDETDNKTLSDIEESVESSHLHKDEPTGGSQQQPTDQTGQNDDQVPPPPPLDSARDAVEDAAGSDQAPDNTDPMQALKDQGLQFEENDGKEDNDDDKPSSPPPQVPPPMTPPDGTT